MEQGHSREGGGGGPGWAKRTDTAVLCPQWSSVPGWPLTVLLGGWEGAAEEVEEQRRGERWGGSEGGLPALQILISGQASPSVCLFV